MQEVDKQAHQNTEAQRRTGFMNYQNLEASQSMPNEESGSEHHELHQQRQARDVWCGLGDDWNWNLAAWQKLWGKDAGRLVSKEGQGDRGVTVEACLQRGLHLAQTALWILALAKEGASDSGLAAEWLPASAVRGA